MAVMSIHEDRMSATAFPVDIQDEWTLDGRRFENIAQVRPGGFMELGRVDTVGLKQGRQVVNGYVPGISVRRLIS